MRLVVQQLDAGSGLQSDLVLVVFSPFHTEPEQLVANGAQVRQFSERGTIVAALDHDLAATREYLQTVTHELECANEELQLLN